MRRIAALPILAVLFAGPALAQDAWKTDKSTCIGVYGALARQKNDLAAWAPVLGKSNLLAIDWAARKQQLLGDSAIFAAASKAYEDNFEMMMLRDRVDGVASGTAAVLGLSQRCDEAFKITPSFTMPE